MQIHNSGLNLSSATLLFVGWVEPISGYVGFRFTQPNLQFVSSIVQCKTQQWPILEPSPTILMRARWPALRIHEVGGHSPPYGALKTTWRNVGWAAPTMIATGRSRPEAALV
jgi:hypothetical protein